MLLQRWLNKLDAKNDLHIFCMTYFAGLLLNLVLAWWFYPQREREERQAQQKRREDEELEAMKRRQREKVGKLLVQSSIFIQEELKGAMLMEL